MCAIEVVVLAGSHWSQLPPLNIWCVPFQLWSRSSMKVSARLPTSGRNGGTTLEPSAWYQTGLPRGSVTGLRIAETRGRPASCRSSDRTTGSPASARRCARHPRASASARFAGIASARAMAVRQHRRRDATAASWRNLRRLTPRISITSLRSAGNAPALPCCGRPKGQPGPATSSQMLNRVGDGVHPAHNAVTTRSQQKPSAPGKSPRPTHVDLWWCPWRPGGDGSFENDSTISSNG